MKNFSISRFGLLMRWLFGLYGKVVMTVVAVIFVLVVALEWLALDHIPELRVAFFGSMTMIFPLIVTSWMFLVPEFYKQRKPLLLLPASNGEKYTAVFVFNVLCIVALLLALFGADALYVLWLQLTGRPHLDSALLLAWTALKPVTLEPEYFYWPLALTLPIMLLWGHSCYVVSSTLFGTRSFIVATAVILAYYALVGYLLRVSGLKLFPVVDQEQMTRTVHPMAYVIYGIYLVWTVWNYRESYRRFCRFDVKNYKLGNYELFKR